MVSTFGLGAAAAIFDAVEGVFLLAYFLAISWSEIVLLSAADICEIGFFNWGYFCFSNIYIPNTLKTKLAFYK